MNGVLRWPTGVLRRIRGNPFTFIGLAAPVFFAALLLSDDLYVPTGAIGMVVGGAIGRVLDRPRAFREFVEETVTYEHLVAVVLTFALAVSTLLAVAYGRWLA